MKGFLGEYGKTLVACLVAVLFIAYFLSNQGFVAGKSIANITPKELQEHQEYDYLKNVSQMQPPTLEVRSGRLLVGRVYSAYSYVEAAKDKEGHPLEVKVTGDVDERGNICPTKAGNYNVTYHVEDSDGRTTTKTITYVAEEESI